MAITMLLMTMAATNVKLTKKIGAEIRCLLRWLPSTVEPECVRIPLKSP